LPNTLQNVLCMCTCWQFLGLSDAFVCTPLPEMCCPAVALLPLEGPASYLQPALLPPWAGLLPPAGEWSCNALQAVNCT
jgi:hypothetical protein